MSKNSTVEIEVKGTKYKDRYHSLKVWPEYYHELDNNMKKFELRENDRDYRIFDYLILREYDPVNDKYTGRQLTRRVTSILHGGIFGLPKTICVMSLDVV